MQIIVRRIMVLLLLGIVFIAFAESGKTMHVVVKEAKVYATPSSFGKVVATLKYTAAVTVKEEKAGWTKISFAGGKQGWIHSSSLESGKTSLKSGSKDASKGASADEVALAGKGFSKEVEDKYKKDNKIDYRDVDRMEKYRSTIDEIRSFLVTGGLEAATGGAK